MLVGVLLAAGAGRRFGGTKLLAPLAGATVGALAARALGPAVDRRLAVVRPRDEALTRLLSAEGFETLPFASASEGMGASLAFGVSAAPEADGWIVALADMPFVRAGTVQSLARLLRAGAPLVAPVFGGRRGHPVGFGRTFLAELTALHGEEGGRSILEAHTGQLVGMNCDDPGVLRDVDSSEDLPAEGREQ